MRILLLTTLMMITSIASAGLYKWVDNDGNVHYSQKPPQDKQYIRLKAPAPAPEEAKPLYKNTNVQNNTTNKTTKTETAKNEEIRASNCKKAKQNLSSYQRSRRVRDIDGNVITIDDNERAKQIREAKQAISDFCD